MFFDDEFNEVEDWLHACYVISSTGNVELCALQDTAHPTITKREIRKLAEILKEDKGKTTIENAIRRIELLAETAGRMQLDAKDRGFHKLEEEYETKRKTIEDVLIILREEER